MDNRVFRDRIEARITELEQGADVSESLNVELDQTRVGRLSRMDAMQLQQMELELKRRQQRELIALKHALKRIEEDEFGYCQDCGEDIHPDRLEIDPAAILCIRCASARER